MAVKDRDRFSTATRIRIIGEQTAARVYRSQTKRQARRSRLTGRAALLAMVLCSLVVALAYPIRQYVAQRAEIADLQREQRETRQRVEDLRDLKARWQDDAYAEQQVRLRLHYVMPGRRGSSSSTRRRPSRPAPGPAPPTVPGTRTCGTGSTRPTPSPAGSEPTAPIAPAASSASAAPAVTQQEDQQKTVMQTPRRPPRAPSRPTRTWRPSSSSSDVRRADCGPSRTAARADSPTWWRRRRGCPTARPSPRCTT